METYEYHQLLKHLYFEGYADSYEEAEDLIEEMSDEEFDFLYEEVFGIDEGYEPLPAQKMRRQVERRSRSAHSRFSFVKDYEKEGLVNLARGNKNELARKASQIKKMKTKLRTHDPLVSQFKELENRARGKERKKFNEEYYVDEGKVEWDNPNRPLQSGFTPREKNRAKRILMDVERPEALPWFDKATTRRYERYGNLKAAHDKEKDKKVQRNKIHKFKKAPLSSSGRTIGQIRRASGANLIRSKSGLKQDVYQSSLKEPKESYEMILNHLLDEGYATSLESAENIALHMSEDWKSDVLKAAKKIAKKVGKTKFAKKAKKFVTRTALGAIGVPLIS